LTAGIAPRQVSPTLPSNLSTKINVSKEFDETIPEMLADLVQLKQVFLNLMCNAMEAMTGEGTIAVTSSYIKNANTIKIEFSDTGLGIDKKIMNDVFKPFFTSKPKRPGLGLTIARQLVEEHGGSLSVASALGSWTTFYVSLPLITERGTQNTEI